MTTAYCFFSTYLETKWQKHDANKNQNLLSTSYGKFNVIFLLPLITVSNNLLF